jgi:ATP-dependent DNA helicase RecQ
MNHSDIRAALKKHYGFDDFRKGQEEVISRIVVGHSTAAIFPTGAGKSLCYQLPALMLPHLTLVVSPLLSLMQDQLDFLLSHNIPAARLDSSLRGEEYNSILTQAVQGDLKILMISVERFKNERFRNRLQQMKISLMVIDEAHCISEWGHNFRPEYLRLPDYQQEFAIEKVLLLTATATEKVRADMCRKFRIAPENLIYTGFYRKNLTLKLSPVEERDKKKKLLSDISSSPDDPTIVYVTLQKTAEETAAFLLSQGIDAAPYHAGMKNEERESIQTRFMEGSLSCVTATIAFGMGIDKSDIRRIIHYDLPKSIENYSQEIGRAGRDGKESLCEVYGNTDKLPVLENFIYGDSPDREGIFQVLEMIKESPGIWETKLPTLSRDVNIRLLPLKTLLVYLSMKKILESMYTYFEEYSFKYLNPPEEILSQFSDERKSFVQSILDNCHSKKVWTSVDMESIERSFPDQRKRVLTALDYFAEKQWIELQAKQAVDAYRVLNHTFLTDVLADELYQLFQEKEKSEIQRIHRMIKFFESENCLSLGLASYFGEELALENCGHCSVCLDGPVILPGRGDSKDFSDDDISTFLTEIRPLLGSLANPVNLTRFLCGISTPLMLAVKARKLKGFGALETYPFNDLLQRIEQILSSDFLT